MTKMAGGDGLIKTEALWKKNSSSSTGAVMTELVITAQE